MDPIVSNPFPFAFSEPPFFPNMEGITLTPVDIYSLMAYQQFDAGRREIDLGVDAIDTLELEGVTSVVERLQ